MLDVQGHFTTFNFMDLINDIDMLQSIQACSITPGEFLKGEPFFS